MTYFRMMIVHTDGGKEQGWDLEITPRTVLRYRPGSYRFQFIWLLWGFAFEVNF